jgi:hypothetical protein
MKWLTEMKPNVRGWFVLTCGVLVLGLHWFEVLHTKVPKFSTAFTTPWFIIVGLMFLVYPKTQQRLPDEGWIAQSKRLWKSNLIFMVTCLASGFLHYQLQKFIFG